jgi:hypothetical protein
LENPSDISRSINVEGLLLLYARAFLAVVIMGGEEHPDVPA